MWHHGERDISKYLTHFNNAKPWFFKVTVKPSGSLSFRVIVPWWLFRSRMLVSYVLLQMGVKKNGGRELVIDHVETINLIAFKGRSLDDHSSCWHAHGVYGDATVGSSAPLQTFMSKSLLTSVAEFDTQCCWWSMSRSRFNAVWRNIFWFIYPTKDNWIWFSY